MAGAPPPPPPRCAGRRPGVRQGSKGTRGTTWLGITPAEEKEGKKDTEKRIEL